MELEGQERVDKTVVRMRFKFHPNRGKCDEWKVVLLLVGGRSVDGVERVFRERREVAGGKAIKENWEQAANGQESRLKRTSPGTSKLGSTSWVTGVSSGGNS
jgi:hypothetical protein